jgi:hypothetical protein
LSRRNWLRFDNFVRSRLGAAGESPFILPRLDQRKRRSSTDPVIPSQTSLTR